jgi:hypothetical protein
VTHPVERLVAFIGEARRQDLSGSDAHRLARAAGLDVEWEQFRAVWLSVIEQRNASLRERAARYRAAHRMPVAGKDRAAGTTA